MKSKRENSDSSSSQKGHLKKDCLASVMPHPSQTGKSEEGEEKSGEQRYLVLFSHSQTRLFSVYSHSLNLMAILLQCIFTRKTGSE